MKLLFLQVLIILSSFTAAAQEKILYYMEPEKGITRNIFSKEQVEDDMQFWLKTLREIHVNPWHSISRKKLKRIQKEILRELPDSVSGKTACLTFSALTAKLNECFLSLATNAETDSQFRKDSLPFSMHIQSISDTFSISAVSYVDNKPSKNFSQIITVNDKPVSSLIKKYLEFFGGTFDWKKIQVMRNFAFLLWLDGIRSPFKLTHLQHGDTLTLEEGGSPTPGWNKEVFETESSGSLEPFTLSFPRTSIALIKITTLENGYWNSFLPFLESAFQEIQQKKPEGLVLDFRDNKGGDIEMADTLLSYFTNNKYRMNAGLKIKLNEFGINDLSLLSQVVNSEDKKAGRMLAGRTESPAQPGPNPLRYEGSVAVLIGKNTRDEAISLADIIREYNLAKLFGESPYEPPNLLRNYTRFMLPNTRIITAAPAVLYVRANGEKKDFSPVRPDIEVKPLPEFDTKNDPVLEKAIEWIIKELHRLG